MLRVSPLRAKLFARRKSTIKKLRSKKAKDKCDICINTWTNMTYLDYIIAHSIISFWIILQSNRDSVWWADIWNRAKCSADNG